ncbi:MAG: hypothetical protein KGZ58_05700 [Ignavibacteriales bacterium]|nr:hypothetical protein [Ignavibacteriales bacterium]
MQQIIQLTKQLTPLEISQLLETVIPDIQISLKQTKKTNIHFLTGKELAQSEIVGLWSEHSIPDSVEYVNQLRKQAELRL